MAPAGDDDVFQAGGRGALLLQEELPGDPDVPPDPGPARRFPAYFTRREQTPAGRGGPGPHHRRGPGGGRSRGSGTVPAAALTTRPVLFASGRIGPPSRDAWGGSSRRREDLCAAGLGFGAGRGEQVPADIPGFLASRCRLGSGGCISVPDALTNTSFECFFRPREAKVGSEGLRRPCGPWAERLVEV